MIPMTSWTPEFCTVCYKQCLVGGVYCSEECRKADLEKNVEVDETMPAIYHAVPPTVLVTDQESVSESSEEDEEVPSLWLTTHNHSEHKPGSRPKNPKAQSLQKKESNFLYASPTLKPSKALKASPTMSPLLIPHAGAVQTPHDQIPTQSVNTYKRWLADGAV